MVYFFAIPAYMNYFLKSPYNLPDCNAKFLGINACVFIERLITLFVILILEKTYKRKYLYTNERIFH